MVSPFRVADPTAAKYFWVPQAMGTAAAQLTLDTFHWLQSTFPFFNASIKADFANHIIVQVPAPCLRSCQILLAIMCQTIVSICPNLSPLKHLHEHTAPWNQTKWLGVQPADYGFAAPGWAEGHLPAALLDTRHLRAGV